MILCFFLTFAGFLRCDPIKPIVHCSSISSLFKLQTSFALIKHSTECYICLYLIFATFSIWIIRTFCLSLIIGFCSLIPAASYLPLRMVPDIYIIWYCVLRFDIFCLYCRQLFTRQRILRLCHPSSLRIVWSWIFGGCVNAGCLSILETSDVTAYQWPPCHKVLQPNPLPPRATSLYVFSFRYPNFNLRVYEASSGLIVSYRSASGSSCTLNFRQVILLLIAASMFDEFSR